MAILCLTAFATAQAGSGLRDDILEIFAVQPGGVLNFDSELANVEIATGESDRVRVEFVREFKVSTAAEADALRQKIDVQMAKADNGLKITVRFTDERRDNDRRRIRINFRIAMPKKFNLDLRTVGSVTVGDLDGRAKLVVIGGSAQMHNVTGPLTAKTEGGSVSVRDVGGDLEARSYGGSVAIGKVNGKVAVRAEGGSVAIKEATDSVDASAAGGSVQAYISKQPRGDSKIVAEAGNVDLRLPESIAVTVDAACSAGRLSSDFSLNGQGVDNAGRWKGVINGGGPLVMLRASAGNIAIRK